jgi:hypothetical protein
MVTTAAQAQERLELVVADHRVTEQLRQHSTAELVELEARRVLPDHQCQELVAAAAVETQLPEQEQDKAELAELVAELLADQL